MSTPANSPGTSVLVTGGLGFIGAHLCRALLRDQPGIELTIVDNLSAAHADFGDLKGRARIFIRDLIEFDPGTARFDEIYHLASPVGSLGILARHGYIAREILLLTYKVAEIAIASRARLLFVSSSEIYGQGGVHAEAAPKVIEERRGTRVEYALGKLLSEHVLLNLATTAGIDVRVCRPFNVIGEGQSSRAGFVVPTFFERALAGEDLPVFYGGEQRRSFCHVSDAIAALLAVQHRGRPGEIYNVGHPHAVTTIHALAGRIVELCGSRSSIVPSDPQQLHGRRYIESHEKIPDVTKLRTETGWEPRVDLEASLRRILLAR